MIDLLRSIPGPQFLLNYLTYASIILLIMLLNLYFKDFFYNNKLNLFKNNLSLLEIAVLKHEDNYYELLKVILISLWDRGVLEFLELNETPCVKANIKELDYSSLSEMEKLIVETYSIETPINKLYDSQIYSELHTAFNNIRGDLIDKNLFKEFRNYRNSIIGFAFVILTPGITKMIMGVYYHKPVLFLLAIVLFFIFIFYFIYNKLSYKTKYGRKILIQLEAEYAGMELENIRKHLSVISTLLGVEGLKGIPQYGLLSLIFPKRENKSIKNIALLFFPDTKNTDTDGFFTDSSGCSDCSSCSDCSGCSDCGGCGGCGD